MNRSFSASLALLAAVALVFTACDSDSDSESSTPTAGATLNASEQQALLDALVGPLSNLAGSGTGGGGQPEAKVSSPLNVTVPCTSGGSTTISGSFTASAASATSFTLTFDTTMTFSSCAQDGYTYDGVVDYDGTMAVTGTSMAMNFTWASSSFSMDGQAHSFSLTYVGSYDTSSSTFGGGTVSGTIDGVAVSTTI